MELKALVREEEFTEGLPVELPPVDEDARTAALPVAGQSPSDLGAGHRKTEGQFRGVLDVDPRKHAADLGEQPSDERGVRRYLSQFQENGE